MKNLSVVIKLKSDQDITYMLNDITDYSDNGKQLILRYGEALGDYPGDTQKIPLDIIDGYDVYDNSSRY